MIYIIDGSETYFIKKEIDKIINNSLDIFEFNYDDKDFSIQQLDECLNGISFLSEKKFIKVNNPSFLIKKTNEIEIKPILDYINNPNYDIDLIFYTYDSLFNKSLKLYKEISKNAQVKSFNSINPYNFKAECLSYLKQQSIKMTEDAFIYLYKNSDNNFTDFTSNVEILKNYPERIDIECIKKLCTFNISSSIFDLLNSLCEGNVSKSISILRNLYKDNNSPFMIIKSLSTQLRFLYQVDFLKSQNYTVNQIADTLNAKEIRVKLSIEKIGNLNYQNIIKMLKKMSDLDILNKSDSNITPESRIELYIMRNFNTTL